MLEELSQIKKEADKTFEQVIDQEEKKTNESVDKATAAAQQSRANSKGKGLMPNIKVVTPRRSPLQDLVIDLEETVNPLSQSRASVRSNKPAQPGFGMDEEDPDMG